MKTIILLVFFGLSIPEVYCQNYIYKGSQQHPSTSTWDFPVNSADWHILKLTVAKTKSGGYLMLSTNIHYQYESIYGPVYLILQNGKLINLPQRVVSDHVDGESKVLYVISSANYELLKQYNIERVRFTIYDNMMKSKENYTADNKKEGGFYELTKYPTAEEIAAIKD